MNGFTKHSIKHLSASSINLWTNAPDVWVAQYLFGKRTPMGAAAMRGICTEDAVVAVLTGKNRDGALDAALEKFDSYFPLGDEKTTKERNMIEPCMDLALGELQQYGEPEFPEEGQEKISITARQSKEANQQARKVPASWQQGRHCRGHTRQPQHVLLERSGSN
jgi:hypothetical protein